MTRYTHRFADLARRDAHIGAYIDIEQPDPDLGAAAGRYVLRDADSGYDLHCAGVSLDFVEIQLDQIEREGWRRCPECDTLILPPPDGPAPAREPVPLAA